MNEYTTVAPIRKELNRLRQSYMIKPQYSVIKSIGITYARLDIETKKLTGLDPDKNECLLWFKSFGKSYHAASVLTWYEAANGALSPYIR